MSDDEVLRFARPDGDPGLEDWRRVHNEIVPPDALTLDEVRERNGRYHLEVAYLGEVAVGCTTVRPPAAGTGTATVIARVLPPYRGRGFGERLYRRGLARARELGAGTVETVVLLSNPAGLSFALSRGFTEFDRYLLPGDTVPYAELRLSPRWDDAPPAP
ncbi:GNAT family N-acetyltransferase [Streptomyces sp. NPDC089919]|uniref:GNAT family N-acetyltransferase n=1 Tax=Streptomyces sp. NPDC089919 TaxID=3155188 RepID=UPI00343724B2